MSSRLDIVSAEGPSGAIPPPSRLVEMRRLWPVLVMCGASLGTGAPLYLYVSSILIDGLVAAFGWTRADAAASFGAIAVSAFAFPIVGRVVDRFGERLTATVSFVLMALGYLCMTRINASLWSFYSLLAATMILGVGTGPIAFTRFVSRRFVAARGTALAIMLCGTSMISILVAPLIGRAVSEFGWQNGFLWLAGLSIVVGAPLSWLGLRETDDQIRGERRVLDGNQPGPDLNSALKSRSFWLLVMMGVLTAPAIAGFTTNLANVFADRGISKQVAAYMVSVLAAGVVVGRLCSGYLFDRIWAPGVAAVVFASAAAGALLLHLSTGAFGPSIVGVLMIGLAQGAEYDMLAYLVSRYLGLRAYGAVYGLLSMSFMLMIPVGAVAFGRLRDITGSYDLSLGAAAVLLACAAGLVLLLGRYPAAGRPG